jgi:hypothetical protein
MTSEITVGGNTVTLVALPTCIAPKMVEPWIVDSVGSVAYPFSGQTQTQEWPGADKLGMMVTLPPLTLDQAAEFKAFLMQMRGIRNAVQLPDYKALTPRGVIGASVPLVDGTVSSNNRAGSQLLVTKGWEPGKFRMLLPGDALQIGYRLHYNLEAVASDVNGNATLKIWPAHREKPADGTPLSFKRPLGLFRLGENRRGWTERLRVTDLSFPVVEYR